MPDLMRQGGGRGVHVHGMVAIVRLADRPIQNQTAAGQVTSPRPILMRVLPWVASRYVRIMSINRPVQAEFSVCRQRAVRPVGPLLVRVTAQSKAHSK